MQIKIQNFLLAIDPDQIARPRPPKSKYIRGLDIAQLLRSYWITTNTFAHLRHCLGWNLNRHSKYSKINLGRSSMNTITLLMWSTAAVSQPKSGFIRDKESDITWMESLSRADREAFSCSNNSEGNLRRILCLRVWLLTEREWTEQATNKSEMSDTTKDIAELRS